MPSRKNKNSKDAELIRAVQRGKSYDIPLMIENGANINAKSKDGTTPLMWAMKRGYLGIAKLLVERGADVKAKNKGGETALSLAEKRGDFKIAKFLLENGAGRKARNKKGGTASSDDALDDNLEIAEHQLFYGKDVNKRNKNGATQIMWAAWSGDLGNMKYLLEKGADVNAKANDGKTALIWATIGNHLDVASCLLEHGADVNAKTNDGRTALRIAEKKNKNPAIVKLLLSYGASDRPYSQKQRNEKTSAPEKKIRFIDLCSGIGGGRMGLEKNGFQCVAYSEILETSIENYKRFYNTDSEKALGDLTLLKPEDIPDADMLIAGFPCQTFSIAGKRKGFADDRGQIIFYIRDILVAKGIKYFILENVKGLINHDHGMTLSCIVELLKEAGYNLRWKMLASTDYGLPQKRERIYFVGTRKDLGCADYEFPSPKGHDALKNYLIDTDEKYVFHNFGWFNRYLNNKYNKNKFNLSELLKEDYLVVDTRQSDLRLYRDFIPTLRTGRSGILYVRDGTLRKISGRESLLLQGFGVDVFNKAKGITDTLLLQQTGNAMSVNVIEELGKSLKPIMKEKGDL